MSGYRSIEWVDGTLRVLDQRQLPHRTVYLDYTDYREVATAIRDNVCLVVDSTHFFTAGNRLEDLAPVPASRIGIVHLADLPSAEPPPSERGRLMPGDGALDLQGFCCRLLDCGYDGFFSVELFNEAIWRLPPEGVAQVAMASLRQYLPMG